METKIVKVTDKGQISIPIEIRNSIGINNGDELFVINNGDSVIMRKIKKSDFRDLLKHSEKTAIKLWDNKEDEIWNNV
jgi:AbrB family looped-hinge helix DNA binding protein